MVAKSAAIHYSQQNTKTQTGEALNRKTKGKHHTKQKLFQLCIKHIGKYIVITLKDMNKRASWSSLGTKEDIQMGEAFHIAITQ